MTITMTMTDLDHCHHHNCDLDQNNQDEHDIDQESWSTTLKRVQNCDARAVLLSCNVFFFKENTRKTCLCFKRPPLQPLRGLETANAKQCQAGNLKHCSVHPLLDMDSSLVLFC